MIASLASKNIQEYFDSQRKAGHLETEMDAKQSIAAGPDLFNESEQKREQFKDMNIPNFKENFPDNIDKTSEE